MFLYMLYYNRYKHINVKYYSMMSCVIHEHIFYFIFIYLLLRRSSTKHTKEHKT